MDSPKAIRTSRNSNKKDVGLMFQSLDAMNPLCLRKSQVVDRYGVTEAFAPESGGQPQRLPQLSTTIPNRYETAVTFDEQDEMSHRGIQFSSSHYTRTYKGGE